MAQHTTERIQSASVEQHSDDAYLDLLKDVDFEPIFIMAEHRSGTTLLYQTLVATKSFNYLKTYHIVNYDRILFNHINRTEKQACKDLEESFKSLAIKDRTIDNVQITPDFSEEYGFILRNAGYDWHLNEQNIPLFKELCKKIQFSSDPHNPLLLKNPWCFSHFMYVKSVFPQAKFIFIHRNPIHIVNSKLKASRSLLFRKDEYAAMIDRKYKNIFQMPMRLLFHRLTYSSYLNLGVRQVTNQVAQSTKYFVDNIDALPKTDYVSLSYEELCQKPEATIQRILKFLGLRSRVNLDYDSFIQPRPLNLLPEVKRNYDEICQKLQPYLTYHCYQP